MEIYLIRSYTHFKRSNKDLHNRMGETVKATRSRGRYFWVKKMIKIGEFEASRSFIKDLKLVHICTSTGFGRDRRYIIFGGCGFTIQENENGVSEQYYGVVIESKTGKTQVSLKLNNRETHNALISVVPAGNLMFAVFNNKMIFVGRMNGPMDCVSLCKLSNVDCYYMNRNSVLMCDRIICADSKYLYYITSINTLRIIDLSLFETLDLSSNEESVESTQLSPLSSVRDIYKSMKDIFIISNEELIRMNTTSHKFEATIKFVDLTGKIVPQSSDPIPPIAVCSVADTHYLYLNTNNGLFKMKRKNLSVVCYKPYKKESQIDLSKQYNTIYISSIKEVTMIVVCKEMNNILIYISYGQLMDEVHCGEYNNGKQLSGRLFTVIMHDHVLSLLGESGLKLETRLSFD